MSVNHTSMTTHAVPHSLPSFAAAFPPIHHQMDRDKARLLHRSPSSRELSRNPSDDDIGTAAGRKRPHIDDERRSDSGRASPATVRIKEENGDHQDAVQPPPNASPVKKRRMTITGAPVINTDFRNLPDQANSTPISPVVMGFTVPKDNPKEMEQLKTMMTVKQKQKALIEQRRGSLAPEPSTTTTTTTKPSTLSVKNARRSPSGGAPTRPVALSGPSAASAYPPTHQSAQTLPPPPISFARRRAAQLGAKRKPADLLISPREHPEGFIPSIHSAPPTQGAFNFGSHMALPRLPSSSIMNSGGGDAMFPPTPTRLSQHLAAPSITISESAPRSPMASIPIASSLVPPTPAFNQSDFNNGDKAAFLAPFGYFYDALNDAKQLKTWLGDQLQRSNSLYQNLSKQQERLNESVEQLVDKKLAGIRQELTGLRHRVLELEDALHDARTGRDAPSSSSYHTGKANGYSSSSVHHGGPPDSYTFPPLRPDMSSSTTGRVASPRSQEMRGEGEYENPPYDARRPLPPSLSASRLDPPPRSHDPSPLGPPASHGRISMIMQSPPPPVYHDSSSYGKQGPSSRSAEREFQRPGPPSRQASYNGSSQEREREREWERRHDRSPPPMRRADGRMSPPDSARMDES
ncbi:hypothetical protein BKA70DRAFT_1280556 [Coprinopsis sp. MPI-PUGE-AT-0042]|nr:hypothetical protein BKA70DRAFT_1280556 [Coprinopsis sp. MPI-PUGE-AT-0042]